MSIYFLKFPIIIKIKQLKKLKPYIPIKQKLN